MKIGLAIVFTLVSFFISLKASDENTRMLFSSLAIINCAIVQYHLTPKTLSKNE